MKGNPNVYNCNRCGEDTQWLYCDACKAAIATKAKIKKDKTDDLPLPAPG